MATFRGSRYPALMVRIGERKFKFVGGRLSVDDADAPMIEEFAARRPEYAIVRENIVGRPDEAAQPAATPPVSPEAPPEAAAEIVPAVDDPDDGVIQDVPVKADELREELRRWGLPASGAKNALWDRLEEAYVEAELEAEEDPE